MSNENTDSITNLLATSLAILADTSTKDRPIKRRAIESVKKETLEIKSRPNASTLAAKLLEEFLDRLLICTESAIESVREHIVGIIHSLIMTCNEGDVKKGTVEKLLKTLLDRMGYQNTVMGKTIKEPTEEIRAAWMELCVTLLDRAPNNKISVCESELFMDTIKTSGEDPFADVLKQCAKLIITYSQKQPKSVDYACDRMIRLTIPLLVHKHTAVRVLGVKAVESVLMASPKGLHLLFEFDEKHNRQAVVPELIFDSSAMVRDCLFVSLGNLICNWSPRDRYQYGEQILPLILSGTFDELPSVQDNCWANITKVGKSCTLDLYNAAIIHEIPKDDEVIGLKHLVHMCFKQSLTQILEGCIDFIVVRQRRGLDSLELFLKYASTDDLVKFIKRIVNCLMNVFINSRQEPSTKTKLFNILTLVTSQLLLPDIYLDALLPNLERGHLAKEPNGLPGSMVVLVVMVFLEHFVSQASAIEKLSPAAKQRILTAIDKPHLKEFYDSTILQHLETIRSKLL